MNLWLIGAGLFLLFIVANSMLRIIRQHEKGIIETLGKYSKTTDSGLTFIFPFLQSLRLVDMREQVLDVPPQDVITKDNVSVTVDAVIYFQITDPFKVTYNVADFYLATVNLAQTTLRNIIGDMELDHTLTSRDTINVQLRTVLDEATDRWGVKVTRVELKAIEPPRDITDAMSKQMKAEREKRAVVLDAEGIRQAQILKADGEKQSEVLRAEGHRQSVILEAEGRAQSIKTVADAQKYEIETVYNAIHDAKPDDKLIAIKYLEALPKVANGQATKVFLPLETSGIIGSLAGISEIFKDKQQLPEKLK
ncbi:SPFH/Band 7/PHB domain protein [bacterium]|nr:SPFH/Band 7/PHB domain protein [bacterium]